MLSSVNLRWQGNACKRNMNTFAFVGDLANHPEVSCVYHSEEAENQFLKGERHSHRVIVLIIGCNLMLRGDPAPQTLGELCLGTGTRIHHPEVSTRSYARLFRKEDPSVA